MKHAAWIACAVLVFPTIACANTLYRGLNAIGIYGEAVGTPNSYHSFNTQGLANSFRTMKPASGGNTSGGVGVYLSGMSQDDFFMHLGFNYGFSPIIGNSNGNMSSSGHSMAFNARLGKGFQFGPDLLIGPYIGYQYARFQMGVGNNGAFGTATYNNNALGGGLFMAMAPAQDLTLTAHAGYLVGLSANERVKFGAFSLQPGGTPDADVFQAGAKLSYRFLPDLSGFVGVNYDHYMASGHAGPVTERTRVNVLRGLAGVAYNF